MIGGKRGWFGESHRHYLARKGVKTAFVRTRAGAYFPTRLVPAAETLKEDGSSDVPVERNAEGKPVLYDAEGKSQGVADEYEGLVYPPTPYHKWDKDSKKWKLEEPNEEDNRRVTVENEKKKREEEDEFLASMDPFGKEHHEKSKTYRAEKAKYEWVVQGKYPGSRGWEDLTAEEDRNEARERLREYNENEGQYPHRLVRKKEEEE